MNRLRVVFPYFAQQHQILHSLPIAAAMATLHSGLDVHVAAAPEHLDFIRRLLQRHAPQAPLVLDTLALPLLTRLPSKKRTMLKNRAYLRGFDAIVTPERTSLFLRHIVPASTRLVWTRHGAGDRAVGFSSDVDGFDFVLMAGRKIEARLLEQGLIRPGHYQTGVYAKFDWLLQPATPLELFEQPRPTVLYCPHFEPELSSWPGLGTQVLDYFAASTRYNLIFAPHLRLYAPATPAKYRAFRRYQALPNIHVDLGSERSVDMSYVGAADLYLGDVSSQVAEFIARPRPCLFLDAHATDWEGDPNYALWTLGPVLRDLGDLDSQLDAALAEPLRYRDAQQAYFAATFGEVVPGESAARGANAIAEFLRRGTGQSTIQQNGLPAVQQGAGSAETLGQKAPARRVRPASSRIR